MTTGGPLLRSRVVGVSVHINRIGQLPSANADVGTELARMYIPSTTSGHNFSSFSALLRSTVTKAVGEALSGLPDWKIMEPVMAVEIQVPLDDGKLVTFYKIFGLTWIDRDGAFGLEAFSAGFEIL